MARLRGPFQTDGQAIILEDYLEIRPERRAQLQRLAREGKLVIGPWYVLPDEFLVSGESLDPQPPPGPPDCPQLWRAALERRLCLRSLWAQQPDSPDLWQLWHSRRPDLARASTTCSRAMSAGAAPTAPSWSPTASQAAATATMPSRSATRASTSCRSTPATVNRDLDELSALRGRAHRGRPDPAL